jgi:glycosyltransferase involved in cell wall biosynthesis
MVVGAGASRELREVGERLGQGVSFLDYVENLDALCGSSLGMVAPLRFGTGIKIKVIEGLARGLPVISTRFGIDGLDLKPGTHCLVEDDLAGFAKAMIRLLDPALNADFARRSFACYRERLAPEVVARGYRSALFGDRAPDAMSGDNPLVHQF